MNSHRAKIIRMLYKFFLYTQRYLCRKCDFIDSWILTYIQSIRMSYKMIIMLIRAYLHNKLCRIIIQFSLHW